MRAWPLLALSSNSAVDDCLDERPVNRRLQNHHAEPDRSDDLDDNDGRFKARIDLAGPRALIDDLGGSSDAVFHTMRMTAQMTVCVMPRAGARTTKPPA